MTQRDHLVEIPKSFHSFSSGLPFDRCIDCDKFLLDDDMEYFIEKAVRQYNGFTAQDVIFEYAICSTCAEAVKKSISQSSMLSIEQYFVENIDFNARMKVLNNHPNDPEQWINQCLVSQQSISEAIEYQVFAQCNGKYLTLSQMPYMVSGKVLDQIQEVLSTETRDELNDFMDRNLGPSPELAEVLPGRRVVLI